MFINVPNVKALVVFIGTDVVHFFFFFFFHFFLPTLSFIFNTREQKVYTIIYSKKKTPHRTPAITPRTPMGATDPRLRNTDLGYQSLISYGDIPKICVFKGFVFQALLDKD